jgi:hypothetical protein
MDGESKEEGKDAQRVADMMKHVMTEQGKIYAIRTQKDKDRDKGGKS